MIVSEWSPEGKAVMFAEWDDRLNVFDTLVLCRFYRD